MAATLLLGGCSASFHGGSAPPIDRLAGLTVGVSSAADVQAALGTSPGHGAIRLPDAPPQDMRVWQSQQMEGKASHQDLLLVFIDRTTGTFNGYMWFRSGALMAQTR